MFGLYPESSITFQTRFARRGSTVGMRLNVRETVAVDTLARLAISRMFIETASTLPKRGGGIVALS